MKRRLKTRLTPQKVYDEVSYSTLDWPLKTAHLQRNSLNDYCQRPVSPNVSVAELYHENSKLFPQMLGELTATQMDVEEFRRDFVVRRSKVEPVGDASGMDLDPWCRELLTAAAKNLDVELFYAVEIWVLAGETLMFHEPVSDTLQVIKQLSSSDLEALRDALRLMVDPREPLHKGPVLCILGNFARNDMLYSRRGYRRTLLEAGHVTGEVVRQAARLGVAAKARFEFSDRDLDALLEADGIEVGILVALELGSNPDVG